MGARTVRREKEADSEKLGGVAVGAPRGGTVRRRGVRGARCYRVVKEKERKIRSMGGQWWEGCLGAISGEWKGQSQHMARPGTHFKTGLKSISYGDALFTLIILYQVGVSSCSV